MTTTKDPTRAKMLAQHTLHCTPCGQKAKRLMQSPAHLERQELLCAIEYCEHRTSGRRLHA